MRFLRCSWSLHITSIVGFLLCTRYSAVGVLFWLCHVEYRWYGFYIMNKWINVMYYQGFDSSLANVMLLLILTYSLSWYADMGGRDCRDLNYVEEKNILEISG